MKEEWSIFYTNLPKKVKLFLVEKIGKISDFELTSHANDFNEIIVFTSKSAKIEISIWGDLGGLQFAVWYPEAKKNNLNGDPSATDHEFTLDYKYFSFLYKTA